MTVYFGTHGACQDNPIVWPWTILFAATWDWKKCENGSACPLSCCFQSIFPVIPSCIWAICAEISCHGPVCWLSLQKHSDEGDKTLHQLKTILLRTLWYGIYIGTQEPHPLAILCCYPLLLWNDLGISGPPVLCPNFLWLQTSPHSPTHLASEMKADSQSHSPDCCVSKPAKSL